MTKIRGPRITRMDAKKDSSKRKSFALIRVIRGQISLPLLFVSIRVH